MRLVCPNCGAQYEVDDSAIPDAGRDVQCSACGQVWFQPGPFEAEDRARRAAEAREEEDERASGESAQGPVRAPRATAEGDRTTDEAPLDEIPRGETAAPAAAASAVPEAEAPEAETPDPAPAPRVVSARVRPVRPSAAGNGAAAPLSAPQPQPQRASDEAADTAPSAAPAPRRPLDESLLAILREEAEREARARRAEGAPLEMQEELPLAASGRAAAERAARKLGQEAAFDIQQPAAAQPAAAQHVGAATRVEPPLHRPAPDFSDLNQTEAVEAALDEEERVADLDSDAPPPGARVKGREKLPDIEAINSSLRASADRGADDFVAYDAPQTLEERRAGFRMGFSAVMAIAAIALALYVLAPRIAALAPPAAPALGAYVAGVDAGRVWLDGELTKLIRLLQPAG